MENVLRIVLLVGIALVAMVVVLAIIAFASDNNSLSEAQANLDNAISIITVSFAEFGSKLRSGLGRFLEKLRQLFLLLTDRITLAYSQTLTFLSDVFNQLFRYVERMATDLARFYIDLFGKFQALMNVHMASIFTKLNLLPANVILKITLALVELYLQGFQVIFCFAFHGLEAFGNLLNEFVVQPVLGFLTNPNNVLVSTLRTFFTSTIGNFFTSLGNQIASIPATVLNFFAPAFAPFIYMVQLLRCGLFLICHPIPEVECPTSPGTIFGPLGVVFGVNLFDCSDLL